MPCPCLVPTGTLAPRWILEAILVLAISVGLVPPDADANQHKDRSERVCWICAGDTWTPSRFQDMATSLDYTKFNDVQITSQELVSERHVARAPSRISHWNGEWTEG